MSSTKFEGPIPVLEAASLLADYINKYSSSITKQELQFALYYSQGVALATFGRPFFDAKIYAAKTGPLCLEIEFEELPVDNDGMLKTGGNQDTEYPRHVRYLATSSWQRWIQQDEGYMQTIYFNSDPVLNAMERYAEGKFEDREIDHDEMKEWFMFEVEEILGGDKFYVNWTGIDDWSDEQLFGDGESEE